MPSRHHAAVCVATLALPACAGADLTVPGAANAGASTGSAVLALHEDTCFESTPADVTLKLSAASRDVESESATGDYDHTGCRNHFVVDVDGTGEHALTVTAGAMGIDLASKDWCEGFWSEHEARGCVGKPCAWAELGAWTERADWHPGEGGAAGHCERVVTGNAPDLSPDHGFTRVRVVSQGGWVYWYKPVFVRFTAR